MREHYLEFKDRIVSPSQKDILSQQNLRKEQLLAMRRYIRHNDQDALKQVNLDGSVAILERSRKKI